MDSGRKLKATREGYHGRFAWSVERREPIQPARREALDWSKALTEGNSLMIAIRRPKLTLWMGILVVAFVLTSGYARPALAQDFYAVIEIFNSTDATTITYDLRWGDQGKSWTVEPHRSKYHYYPYAFPNQNTSPTPSISFQAGMAGQNRGDDSIWPRSLCQPLHGPGRQQVCAGQEGRRARGGLPRPLEACHL